MNNAVLTHQVRIGQNYRVVNNIRPEGASLRGVPPGAHLRVIGFTQQEVFNSQSNRIYGLKPGFYRRVQNPVFQYEDPRTGEYIFGEFELGTLVLVDDVRDSDDLVVGRLFFSKELPELPIWEGDLVRRDGRSGLYRLVSIQYYWPLKELAGPSRTPDGYPNFYCRITQADLGDTSFQETVRLAELELVERGNHWRYENDPSSVRFETPEDASRFYRSVAALKDVRYDDVNSPDFIWTRPQLIEGLKEGRICGYSPAGTDKYFAYDIIDELLCPGHENVKPMLRESCLTALQNG